MDQILEVKAGNFDKEILEADGLVLVCFYAVRSEPSKELQRALKELQPDLAGRFKLTRVNLKKERRLAASYHVRSAPTLLLFRSGKVRDAVSGNLPLDALRAKLDYLLEEYAPTRSEQASQTPDRP